MAAPTSLDELVTKARVISPEYTGEELAAAHTRLAVAATEHLISGALTFGDAAGALLRPEPTREEEWAAAAGDVEARERLEAADDLAHLCKIVISRVRDLHTMSEFMGDRTPDSGAAPSRVLEPAGARVLACVLHLAGREDSARFWWQFAAGADDGLARFCLFLHHLTLGEIQEANWWHDQVPKPGREMWARAVQEGRDEETAGASSCLQAVARHRTVPAAASAVVVYVRTAIEVVDDDDIDLFLPADGFAARIEEMTTGV